MRDKRLGAQGSAFAVFILVFGVPGVFRRSRRFYFNPAAAVTPCVTRFWNMR